MGGAYFLLLSSLVVTVEAQWCTKPVGDGMTLKDEYILLTEFPDGVTVAFACEIGYEPAGGSGKITCTNGSWSRLTLRCQRKTCGAAREVENGVIDYSQGNQFGDIATVTCNEGYDLVGNRELICGDQGWLNRPPVCEVVECDPPSKIINGMFDPVKDSYAYGDVVNYSCRADHTVNGSESLTCSDDGTFKPNPPECLPKEVTTEAMTTTITTTTTTAPMDKTPDGGENNSAWGYILGVAVAVAAAVPLGAAAALGAGARGRAHDQNEKQ